MNRKTRKAIILAASPGTRFLSATKVQPKEMLPIVDKPSIQYIIEEAIKKKFLLLQGEIRCICLQTVKLYILQ